MLVLAPGGKRVAVKFLPVVQIKRGKEDITARVHGHAREVKALRHRQGACEYLRPADDKELLLAGCLRGSNGRIKRGEDLGIAWPEARVMREHQQLAAGQLARHRIVGFAPHQYVVATRQTPKMFKVIAEVPGHAALAADAPLLIQCGQQGNDHYTATVAAICGWA